MIKQSEKAKRLNPEARVAEKEAKAARRTLSKAEVRREIRGNTAVERKAERLRRSAKDAQVLGEAAEDEAPRSSTVFPEPVPQRDADPAASKSIAVLSRERWLSR